MPASNLTTPTVAAGWTYCWYVALASLLALFGAMGDGPAAGRDGGRGIAASRDGGAVPQGVVLTGDSDAHEECALVEATPEAGDDTAALACPPTAAGWGFAARARQEVVARPLRGAWTSEQLPRGPPATRL